MILSQAEKRMKQFCRYFLRKLPNLGDFLAMDEKNFIYQKMKQNEQGEKRKGKTEKRINVWKREKKDEGMKKWGKR